MDRFFFRIYRTITKHKAFSIVAFLLVLTVLAFVASKITFEEDISKLIPTNSKTAEIQQVLKSVNFTDKIIVNIKIEKGGTVEDLIEYATQYIDSTSKNYGYYIKNIQGKVADDDILGTLEFVYENLPVFLEKEDYKVIGQKINADSIQAITEANYKTLLSPSGIVAKNTLLKDPLGISFIALKRLKQLGIGDDFKLKDGFLLSKNDENILLFITPKFGSSETAQNTKFAESLYKLQDGLNENFKGKAQSEYFGAALIAVANANQIKRDIQFTVGIALFLLIIILIFFYRKIWIPLVLFVPTAFGGLLAIAFLYFFRGQVSAISLGIGSVLLGVTLDYSLHILTHIRNNESIKNLYKDVAEPILMSSLTTALAFLCLLFLDSQALQDLGIFAAVSVLGASFFALLFIPFVYKNPQDREIKLSFLDKLAAHNYHKNKWILGILAICLILSAFTYGNVIFNKDISKLNFEPTEIVKAKENLDALTDLSSKSIYIATYGKSTEETLQKNDSIYKLLEKLKAEGKILSYSNIGALVHSKKTQRQKITNWQQFWDSETIDSTKFNLVESGNVFGFKPTTFTRFYELLESDFQPILPEDYQVLPSVILEDYITTEADFTTVTSLVKLDNANATAVKSMFRGIPKILVIDRQEMNETFFGRS